MEACLAVDDRYPTLLGLPCYDLGSISSTFYVQLLRAQIPKAEKDTDNVLQ